MKCEMGDISNLKAALDECRFMKNVFGEEVKKIGGFYYKLKIRYLNVGPRMDAHDYEYMKELETRLNGSKCGLSEWTEKAAQVEALLHEKISTLC